MSTAQARILSSALELKEFDISRLAEHAGVSHEAADDTISHYRKFFRSVDNPAGSSTSWQVLPTSVPLIANEITDLLPNYLKEAGTEEHALGVRISLLVSSATKRLQRMTADSVARRLTKHDIGEGLGYILSDLRVTCDLAAVARQNSFQTAPQALRQAFSTAGLAALMAQEQAGVLGDFLEELAFTRWHALRISLFSLLTPYDKIICIIQDPRVLTSSFLLDYKKTKPADSLFFLYNLARDLKRALSDWIWHFLFVFWSRSGPKLITNLSFATVRSDRFRSGLYFSRDFGVRRFEYRLIHPELRRQKRRADEAFRAGEETGDVLSWKIALDNYYILYEQSQRRDYATLAIVAQNQIGNTKLRIGMYANSVHMLEGAQSAFSQILKAIPKDRAPRSWVEAMNNLGAAKMALGLRENDVEKLKEALAAFTQAMRLSETIKFNRDFVIKNNIANVLVNLYEHVKTQANLDEATYFLDLAAQKTASHPNTPDWAIVCTNKGTVRIKQSGIDNIGELEKGVSEVGKAYVYFNTHPKFSSFQQIVAVLLQEQLDRRRHDGPVLLNSPQTKLTSGERSDPNGVHLAVSE